MIFCRSYFLPGDFLPGEPLRAYKPGRTRRTSTRANQGAKYTRANQANQGEPGTRANQEPGADISQHLGQSNQGEPGRGSTLNQDQHQDQANQGEPAPGSAPAPGSGQDQHQDQHQVKKPPGIVQKTINSAWNCTKNDQSAQKTYRNPKILSVYGLPTCIIADFSDIFADFRRFSPILPKMPKNPFGVWVSVFGVRVANVPVYGLPN